MAGAATISRKGGMLEAEVNGEVIALNVDNGTCYGFNPTASRIWTLLAEPKTLAEICDSLTGEFEVGRDECEREVVALIRDLEGDGLVEVDGALPATEA